MDSTNQHNISICSYNCNGFKGSISYIESLCQRHDITFLSETMLQSSDQQVALSCFNDKFWTAFTWSENVTIGRPSGGLAFILKRHDMLTYSRVQCDSERIIITNICDRQKAVIFTIVGVYLPANTGTVANRNNFIETLNILQGVLDNINNPYTVVGDFNASLPIHKLLSTCWYKTRPFTPHSKILYDFMRDNELCVGNIQYPQPVTYTWKRGRNQSLIDFIALNKGMLQFVDGCITLHDESDNISDHLAIVCDLTIGVKMHATDQTRNSSKSFPIPKWDNKEFQDRYIQALTINLQEINLQNMDQIFLRDHAVKAIECLDQCLSKAIHSAVHQANPKKCVAKKNHLSPHWTKSCSQARDRHRLWHSIYKDNGRPSEGIVYDCYKMSKTQFRQACRTAVNDSKSQQIADLCATYKHCKTGTFWNKLKRMGENSSRPEYDITITELSAHFRNKFKCSDFDATCEGEQLHEEVNNRYNDIINSPDRSFIFTTQMVQKYIDKLNMAAAPGINGIEANHIKIGLKAGLSPYISYLLTLCVRFSIVPDSFVNGLLIPIPKKANCDTTDPSNYRPIIISVVLSKLIELYVLDTMSYDPHSHMFGFIEDRGTEMAISLTHDIINTVRNQGSTTYMCSLDAQAAFDGISHSVLFDRARHHFSERAWALMYMWYSNIKATLILGNQISEPIPIYKGTRQGGLTSSAIFNIVYQSLVQNVNNLSNGVTINNKNYNILAYADDVLLISTTPNGLQLLINKACNEISKIGLNFNPSKTFCHINGPKQYKQDVEWKIDSSRLEIRDTICYLGADINNNSSAAHTHSRMNACIRSFYGLSSTGLTSNSMSYQVKSTLWNTILRPTLTYACAATPINQQDMRSLESCQAKLVKQSLKLSKFCHSTHLLAAMKIHRLEMSIKIQTLNLLRSNIRTKTAAQDFNISQWSVNTPNTLIHRSKYICHELGLNVFKVLYDHNYLSSFKSRFFHCEPNGIVDSIKYLLSPMNYENRNLLHLMLMPF